MDDEQFKAMMKELDTIKRLMMLNATKAGADSDAIGKCTGISSSHVRNILAGNR